jgi:hypothetical protein
MLKRYTNLRPEDLHKLKTAAAATTTDEKPKPEERAYAVAVRITSQWRV